MNKYPDYVKINNFKEPPDSNSEFELTLASRYEVYLSLIHQDKSSFEDRLAGILKQLMEIAEGMVTAGQPIVEFLQKPIDGQIIKLYEIPLQIISAKLDTEAVLARILTQKNETILDADGELHISVQPVWIVEHSDATTAG